MRHVEPDHFGPVIGVAQHQRLRHDLVAQNRAVVIDVPEKRVQRGDALAHAAIDMVPLGRGQDPRHQIERQDAVDRVAVRVNREGDAEIVQLGLGDFGAAAQIVRRDLAQPRQDLGDPRVARRAIHHLTVKSRCEL